jgi:hypothetical protein
MVDPQAARHQIDLRLEALRALPRTELIELPSAAIEAIRFGSEEWSLTTYVQAESGGDVRVVVQIGPSQQPKLLLLRVQADGFRLDTHGSTSPLSERELLEFC